jgi:hemerythrin
MINDMCTGYRYCEPLADAHFIAYSYKIFEFIRSHFAAEEKILAAIQYPYLEKHRRRHQNLLKILLSQMRKFDLGLPCAPCEFICFLQNDLLTHMAIFDKKYAAFKPRLQAL